MVGVPLGTAFASWRVRKHITWGVNVADPSVISGACRDVAPGRAGCMSPSAPKREDVVDKGKLDSLADGIIAEAESHMRFVDSRHLASKEDATFFGVLIGGHIKALTGDDRDYVVQRLATFGRCLEVEFDSPELSQTFLSGLQSTIGGPLPAPPELQKRHGWTFKTKKRGGIKFERHLKVRQPGGGSIGT
jgi:hypothetical protein